MPARSNTEHSRTPGDVPQTFCNTPSAEAVTKALHDMAIHTKPASVTSSEHPGASTGSTTAAILIAEDEEIVRAVATTALERAGFLVLPACNGEAAIEIFRNGSVNIDALLTDVQMGDGITGIALAERVLNERPRTAVLVMSGFPEAELLATERNFRFLAKPFTPTDLVEQVRHILATNTPAQH